MYANPYHAFIDAGFTLVMTSNILGIPLQTLRNRMVEEGLKVHDHKYVTISDKKLDETIYLVLKTTPTIGKNYMYSSNLK